VARSLLSVMQWQPPIPIPQSTACVLLVGSKRLS